MFALRAADPLFPYGRVCFRKSNPPKQDWARDHATATRIGMNTFRHWFMWESIAVAPGKYDWADYDRMMVLTAHDIRQYSAIYLPYPVMLKSGRRGHSP